MVIKHLPNFFFFTKWFSSPRKCDGGYHNKKTKMLNSNKKKHIHLFLCTVIDGSKNSTVWGTCSRWGKTKMYANFLWQMLTEEFIFVFWKNVWRFGDHRGRPFSVIFFQRGEGTFSFFNFWVFWKNFCCNFLTFLTFLINFLNYLHFWNFFFFVQIFF